VHRLLQVSDPTLHCGASREVIRDHVILQASARPGADVRLDRGSRGLGCRPERARTSLRRKPCRRGCWASVRRRV